MNGAEIACFVGDRVKHTYYRPHPSLLFINRACLRGHGTCPEDSLLLTPSVISRNHNNEAGPGC